jgi:hypothetical protein
MSKAKDDAKSKHFKRPPELDLTTSARRRMLLEPAAVWLLDWRVTEVHNRQRPTDTLRNRAPTAMICLIVMAARQL